MESKFTSLGLASWLTRQTAAVGFKNPTPIQEKCIPPILEGRDCLGCAKTGSGKTAAFALPILQKLSEDPYGVYALVITPTRELAYQIADQFRVFGGHINLKTAVIVGGIDMMKQGLQLAKKPHVVIATPGRLADHIQNTDTVSFKKIKFLVMDEADRLLEPSFEKDLEVIFDALPSSRQTLLFSATLTANLSRVQELAGNKPFFWEAPSEVATVKELQQNYVLMPAKVKDCYLIHLVEELHKEKGKTMILFTPTCRSCHVYALLLHSLELPCAALHSLMSQTTEYRGLKLQFYINQHHFLAYLNISWSLATPVHQRFTPLTTILGRRLASLAKFKSGQVRILVATDVASRGLDIPTVEVVVNVNVPSSSTDYIHRVGRTARADYTMSEYAVDETQVLKRLDTVTITKREVELKLRQSTFGERRAINKKKMRLLEELKRRRRSRKKKVKTQ